MVYVVSQVEADDILALHKTDPALSSIFLAAEYVTQFVQPLCGKLQHERINTSINIIDLSHVGVSPFWRLRKLLSTASNMATAHYPETVKRIYVSANISRCSTLQKRDMGPAYDLKHTPGVFRLPACLSLNRKAVRH
ncbi:hypothetical protein LTR92_011155 [Exophiala xenobiotica]|nr:hypothetical protein LTR92_011155 [Exophiala xenobiotica]KAK5356204.1 hypothetical protein LTR11_011627 [Exophiala xenobiotica]